MIHFHRFLAPLFNELIYRFLVNNNRRVRDGGGGVYVCTLYGVRLARGEEKNGLLIFVVLARRPPITLVLTLCFAAPLPATFTTARPSPPLTHTRVSPFFHNRRHRHRRCATETR